MPSRESSAARLDDKAVQGRAKERKRPGQTPSAARGYEVVRSRGWGLWQERRYPGGKLRYYRWWPRLGYLPALRRLSPFFSERSARAAEANANRYCGDDD